MLFRGTWDSPPERKPAFVPREERFLWDAPVILTTADGVVRGQTVNISQSGILVRFNRPVDVWVDGELRLTAEDYIVTVPVRVVRLDGPNTGLIFRVRHDGDRASIRILVEIASQRAAAV